MVSMPSSLSSVNESWFAQCLKHWLWPCIIPLAFLCQSGKGQSIESNAGAGRGLGRAASWTKLVIFLAVGAKGVRAMNTR
jgi:hypothetical protein